MGKATYTVTVTNNSNGVSVDYETEAPMTLLIPDVAAEVVKDLVNTVRSYDTENEHEVCGWEGFHLCYCLIAFILELKPHCALTARCGFFIHYAYFSSSFLVKVFLRKP